MDTIVEQMLLQAPTVAGLAYALYITAKQNSRLIDAIITRENCPDEDLIDLSSD